MIEPFSLACPIPITNYSHVTLAHGGGGRLMHDLIRKMFLSAFGGDNTSPHDGAVLDPPTGARLAFTTDSYVVSPIFFPGGNIGELAIYGTVNDLAMCGARASWLSVGFILEEGLPMERLWQVVRSIAFATQRCGVVVATGDTKVVDRGKGDGVYINTSGIGVIDHDLDIRPECVREGDVILVNGDLGRHGIAVMAKREGLELDVELESDCAPLWEQVKSLIDAGVEVHCLRDLTRGGLSSALNEIAEGSHCRLFVDETKVPVSTAVKSVCELLGLDPLYVACEGRFVAFLPERHADTAIEALRQAGAPSPSVIGIAEKAGETEVILKSCIGTRRPLDMLSGEQLPRIC
ncbi:MAG: hydrogenase expression/formation protein HypE [Candidatus Sumerlaeaceae bacterium]|nr:hydrogenase expression/formation protein HypE [Candidatus Sumerlaeaceae bacterium]